MTTRAGIAALGDEPMLGIGWVYHSRPGDGRFSFRYPIFNFVMPADRSASDFARSSWLMRKVFSVEPREYLAGHSGTLGDLVREFLRQELGYQPEKVYLQTIPKMFGYVFNPVSFWFCAVNGRLDAVLCEVNNTFGDRHFYFVRVPSNSVEGESADSPLSMKKVFHVSPFFDRAGAYAFEFTIDSSSGAPISDVRIKYLGDDGAMRLDTRIRLVLQPLARASALRLLFSFGWLTPMVMLKIHWQALRLWWGGIRFHSRPTPPERKVSL